MEKLKKVMIVFGTRPEAIKMAPLIKELDKHKSRYETKVVVTAQHREMLDQVLTVFDIIPDYDLNVMKKNQSLSTITQEVLKGLENIFIKEQPDLVMVHGDTTTSFAASLAAFYQQIAIGHVEAGLRTYDKYFPFPEEANRQLIDVLTDLYFVPTEATRQNLLMENKRDSQIVVTGNTAIDAIRYTSTRETDNSVLGKMTDDKKWILLTMHRRENHGTPMAQVFEAVRNIVEEHENVAVIMPVHMSPVVQNQVKESLSNHDRILLIEPLEVDVFHQVMKKAYVIMTDSGGLQEEAPALNKPVLVLRDKTERPEGEEAGTLKIVGTETKNVQEKLTELLVDNEIYTRMARATNPYGDGYASERIVKAMDHYFKNENIQGAN